MQDAIQAKSALISVFNKEGLAPIVTKMHELGITLYSTGGTAAFIEAQGVPVLQVEDLTSYPSILGGRVKTLHPKVFGGILNRRSNENDQEEFQQYLKLENEFINEKKLSFKNNSMLFIKASSFSLSHKCS